MDYDYVKKEQTLTSLTISQYNLFYGYYVYAWLPTKNCVLFNGCFRVVSILLKNHLSVLIQCISLLHNKIYVILFQVNDYELIYVTF